MKSIYYVTVSHINSYKNTIPAIAADKVTTNSYGLSLLHSIGT